uniref:Uncharacterized protein n=1 Tax=Anopheles farauti TaxID=69004 RepID=A0A182QTW6_9DIPT
MDNQNVLEERNRIATKVNTSLLLEFFGPSNRIWTLTNSFSEASSLAIIVILAALSSKRSTLRKAALFLMTIECGNDKHQHRVLPSSTPPLAHNMAQGGAIARAFQFLCSTCPGLEAFVFGASWA